MRIAHYPLRSLQQTMSKILVGWPNILSRKNVGKTQGTHWNEIFEKIKSNPNNSFKDLANFSSSYLKIPENIDLRDKLELDPISLDFCKPIKIKYSYNFNYNYMNNLLENYVYFAEEIHKFKNILQEKDQLIQDQDLTLKKFNINQKDTTNLFIKKSNRNYENNEVFHYGFQMMMNYPN